MSVLGQRIRAAQVEAGEQAVIEHLRELGLMTEGPIPLADCEHCVHMGCNKDGGHCYMFSEKPGKYCAQFRKDDVRR
jgi:hypothetical protein